jgi:hypothetical protein
VRRSGSTGDYHGRPTRRLASRFLWLEACSRCGPRIVRLGLAGSTENVLAETPEIGWETPFGRYELLGGHRLWYAPEDAERVAAPDSDGLTLTEQPGMALRLDGADEPSTGLRRSMRIELEADAPAVRVAHELRNIGPRPLELAPWSITQLPTGGLVRLPQPAPVPRHEVHPNRLLALWPYASWRDERLGLQDGGVTIRAEPGPRFKLGTWVEDGWLSHERAGVHFLMTFAADAAARYPDMGCNVEIYCDERYVELEILGPLARLEPGQTVALDERWELRRMTPAVTA